MLHSFARLQETKFKFEPELLKYVTQNFVELLNEFDHQGTANALWALGKLQYDPSCVMTDFWTRYWSAFEESLPNLRRVHLVQHMSSWFDFHQVPPNHIKDKLESILLNFDLDPDSVSSSENSSCFSHLIRLRNAAIWEPSEKLLRQYLALVDRSIVLQNQDDERNFLTNLKAVMYAYRSGIGSSESTVNFWPYYWRYLWTNSGTSNIWFYFGTHAKLWNHSKVSPNKELIAKLEKQLMTQDLTGNKFNSGNILKSLIGGLSISRGRYFSNQFNRFAAQLVIDHLDELDGSGLVDTLRMFDGLKIDPSTFSESFWPRYWNVFSERIPSIPLHLVAHFFNYCLRKKLSLPVDIQNFISDHVCSVEMDSSLLYQFVNSLSSKSLVKSLPPKLQSHLIQSFDKNISKLDSTTCCLVSPMMILGWFPKNPEQFWNDFCTQSLLVLPTVPTSKQTMRLLKVGFAYEKKIDEQWFQQAIIAIQKNLSVIDAAILLRDVAFSNQIPFSFSPQQIKILTKTLVDVFINGLDESLDARTLAKGIGAFHVLGINRHSLSYAQWQQFWKITESNISKLSPRVCQKLITWVGRQALNPSLTWWRKMKARADSSTSIVSMFGSNEQVDSTEVTAKML